MLSSNAYHRGLSATAALVLGLASCSRQTLVQGECRPLHGAEICTWGETSGGTVVAFGVTVPLRVIDSAPADAPMTWPPVAGAVIPLPGEVTRATGFTFMNAYWEPHGHPPGPYLVPHFDFHFNAISPEALDAVDCADTTRPGTLPAGYELPDETIPQLGTLVGLCVPKMGMHSLPGTELHSTTPFQASPVVGYYHGSPIFLEPMIAREKLLERKSFTLAIPEIPGRPASAHYPTSFRADYDSAAETYRFVFAGLGAAGAP